MATRQARERDHVPGGRGPRLTKGEMSMRLLVGCLVVLGLLLSGAAFAATAAPPYHVVKTIAVGGDGGWDCLTLDASAHRLYVARSSRVQVVDVEKGVLVGEVANPPGVHGVAIAPELQLGFVSCGQANNPGGPGLLVCPTGFHSGRQTVGCANSRAARPS